MTYEGAMQWAIRSALTADSTSNNEARLAYATTSLAFTALATELRTRIVREELH